MTITWVGSPNYTKGRLLGLLQPSFIVVHWMDGTLVGTDAVFQDKTRDTSAHYGIADETIHQYVQESDTAYHAGTWFSNLRSIGIEHQGSPSSPISDATYATSAALIAQICKARKITPSSKTIVPHSSIINTQCPGSLDVSRLIAAVNAILNPPKPVVVPVVTVSTPAKYVFNENLAPGANNDEVGRLQDKLVSLGFMNAADVKTGRNIYGPRTTYAIAQFQVKHGVLPNTVSYGSGWFGPATRKVMNTL